MTYLRAVFFLVCLLLGFMGNAALAQEEPTVGLFLNDAQAYQGYTLLAPHQHPSTYLIDMEGEMVNSWDHDYRIGSNTILLENGNLLRASRSPDSWVTGGGRGGRIEEIAWDGTLIWQFDYVDDLYTLHHDIKKMPNGNVLATAWEVKNREELIEVGYNEALLVDDAFWTEKIIEFRPILPDSAEIIWEWNAWDHLIQDFDDTKANFGVVSEKPELIDINTGDGESWLHINAIDYHPRLDQIVMSISFFSELWVIDHSTTTEEAAGHVGGRMGFGGDILYRWGNPEMYKAGGPEDRQLFFNHSTEWLPDALPGGDPNGAKLMIFDNGRDRPDMRFSTVRELELPYFQDYDGSEFYGLDTDGRFSTADIVWSYSEPGVFYSNFISGQQRLSNGHTLIAEGMTGRIFEVMPEGEKVWEYVNPVVRSGPLAQGDIVPAFSEGNERLQNSIFRARRYGPNYPGLSGKDLSPKGLIETMRTAVDGSEEVPSQFALQQNYPNPFNPSTSISFTLPQPGHVRLAVYNVIGQRVATLADRRYETGMHAVHFDAALLPSGTYFYRLETNGFRATRAMLLLK